MRPTQSPWPTSSWASPPSSAASTGRWTVGPELCRGSLRSRRDRPWAGWKDPSQGLSTTLVPLWGRVTTWLCIFTQQLLQPLCWLSQAAVLSFSLRRQGRDLVGFKTERIPTAQAFLDPEIEWGGSITCGWEMGRASTDTRAGSNLAFFSSRQYHYACWLVLTGFVLDLADGAVARQLNACSALGESPPPIPLRAFPFNSL